MFESFLIFLTKWEYLSFTDLTRKHAIQGIYQAKIFEKHTRIDCVYRNLSNKILKKHAEKVHKKEKLQITFVVAIVIQMSQSGTDYILWLSMQSQIWSEVFVWISACLRFHKKIFPLDFQSEISKAEVNFSVKSVRELKCSHNFRNYIS